MSAPIFGTWLAIDDDTEEVIAESEEGTNYGKFERQVRKSHPGCSFVISYRGGEAGGMIRDRPRTLARWDARQLDGKG